MKAACTAASTRVPAASAGGGAIGVERVRYGAPPADFPLIIATIEELRAEKNSPVDVIGCAMLADEGSADAPFHHLMAAMLSAQTKDAETAAGVRNLLEMGGGRLNANTV